MLRALPVVLTAGAVIWVALLLAAPLAPAAAFAYEIAARVCHQRPERSFHLAGVALPVCARCFGLYASGAAGALIGWGSRTAMSPTPPAARILLSTAALPTLITFALEWLGLVSFSNVARAIAALPLGAAAGWVFVRMLRAEAMGFRRAGL
jgi:uncharacterized membrane protein